MMHPYIAATIATIAAGITLIPVAHTAEPSKNITALLDARLRVAVKCLEQTTEDWKKESATTDLLLRVIAEVSQAEIDADPSVPNQIKVYTNQLKRLSEVDKQIEILTGGGALHKESQLVKLEIAKCQLMIAKARLLGDETQAR